MNGFHPTPSEHPPSDYDQARLRGENGEQRYDYDTCLGYLNTQPYMRPIEPQTQMGYQASSAPYYYRQEYPLQDSQWQHIPAGIRPDNYDNLRSQFLSAVPGQPAESANSIGQTTYVPSASSQQQLPLFPARSYDCTSSNGGDIGPANHITRRPLETLMIWKWEIVNCVLFLLAIIAIVATLHPHNGQPIPNDLSLSPSTRFCPSIRLFSRLPLSFSPRLLSVNCNVAGSSPSGVFSTLPGMMMPRAALGVPWYYCRQSDGKSRLSFWTL